MRVSESTEPRPPSAVDNAHALGPAGHPSGQGAGQRSVQTADPSSQSTSHRTTPAEQFAMVAPLPSPKQYSVYGIAISDHRISMLAKRVLTFSFLMAAFYIASSLISLGLSGSSAVRLIDTIVSLTMALIIPAIGYCGVRYHDRCVIGLFAVCSLACVITSSFSILFLAMTTVFVDRTPASCASGQGKVQDCSDDPDERTRLRAIFFVYATLEVVGCLLSGGAFYWSNRLYQDTQRSALSFPSASRDGSLTLRVYEQPHGPAHGYDHGAAPRTRGHTNSADDASEPTESTRLDGEDGSQV